MRQIVAGWMCVKYEARVGRILSVRIKITEREDQREAGLSSEPKFLIKVGNDMHLAIIQGGLTHQDVQSCVCTVELKSRTTPSSHPFTG